MEPTVRACVALEVVEKREGAGSTTEDASNLRVKAKGVAGRGR
jgi:hypothetical protein